MISNIKCYRHYLNPNEKFYVEVRNGSNHYINFFLYYNIGEKRVTKPSPIFGPGKAELVFFPDDALSIRMKVVDCFFIPPATICSNSISYFMISRYKVIISPQGNLQCVRI